MPSIGKFRPGQLRQETNWTGLTEDKHLHNAFITKPQYFSNIVKYIVDVNMGMSFTRWLDKFPVKEIDTDQPFKWRLKGFDERTIRLQGAYADANGATAISPSLSGTIANPGQYNTHVYLDFPEKYFSITGHIVGENPDIWKLRIQDDPVQVGTNWRYKCLLITHDQEDFIDPSELDVGTRWSKEGGSVSRYGSERGQEPSFTSPFEMEERTTEFRFQQKVHGNTIDSGKNHAYVVALQDSDGNTHDYWLSYMEWELIKQFYQRQAEIIFYGKTTVDDTGRVNMMSDTGNPIVAGRGMREQFLPTNTHAYTDLSLDRLTQIALDATVGKIDPNNRTFVIGTGEWGLMELHKMLQRELTGNTYSWLGDTTGRAYNWEGGTNSNDIYAKLGQFRGVAVINGIEFKFMWMPHYDDKVRNKKLHPKGGNAESHRMTIMDFGTTDEPNIQKIRIKGKDPQYNVIPGMRSPYVKGGSVYTRNPGIIANAFDGYELHIMDWVGAVVTDPTRIIELVPSILLG